MQQTGQVKTKLARSLSALRSISAPLALSSPSFSRPLSLSLYRHTNPSKTNKYSMLSALVAAMATAARSSIPSSSSKMATTTATTATLARRFSASSAPRPAAALPGSSSPLLRASPSSRAMPSALRAYAADAALVSVKGGEKSGGCKGSPSCPVFFFFLPLFFLH